MSTGQPPAGTRVGFNVDALGSSEPLVHMHLQLLAACALCTCIVSVPCLGHRLGKRVGAEYRPDAFWRSGWEYPATSTNRSPAGIRVGFNVDALGSSEPLLELHL